ncbi:hypothetical protein P691DRAFT_799115 [Macrolepiota fuliginosa MF-IS2]|uniref:Uncharacterized protein n=1 Tax=Macrolepiota fuliginosa MF-IS2 TaxID=1400762 RepID=A0A9P6C321_9AGAR|nr:hypothetical protein P691DRAFT_799115 [Macrolepiota fuliginosa MF-IS2]
MSPSRDRKLNQTRFAFDPLFSYLQTQRVSTTGIQSSSGDNLAVRETGVCWRPPTVAAPSNEQQASQQVPSIRLISAIPSAVGMSSDGGSSPSLSFESSWASISPSMIAPKLDAPARKRLVPKKSKLGLLGVGQKGKDLSDVARRAGADSSSTRGGFEIYVDPTNDPELGDIVVVKKQKSRGALDGMNWGALGEVTNVPNAPKNGPAPSAMLKVKEEEKKWWSIGRGRKDSKEKDRKENVKRAKSPEMAMRSKTPEPLKLNQDGRARFNSLDSGILLNMPINMGFPNAKVSTASEPGLPPHLPAQRSFTPESLKEACREPSPAPPPSRSGTPAPTLNGFLAPPNIASNSKEQGSIALRAIRSMGVNENGAKEGTIREKKNKKEKKDKKEKRERKEKRENKESTVRDKERKEKREKRDVEGTVRLSISSFEAEPVRKHSAQTLGKKKRLPGSTASSGLGARPKERMGSTMSTASSLRPMSMASSSGASASTRESRGSVRWDEQGLESDKREIQKEKKEKRKKKKEEGEDSKRLVEGRRRISITEVFPEVASSQGHGDTDIDQDMEIQKRFSTAFPIVTIQEATVDGHGDESEEIHDSLVYGGILKEGEKIEEPRQTPVKRQRVRPMSEQMLGRARPRAVYEDEEDLTPLRPPPLPANILGSVRSTANLEGSPLKKVQLGNDSPLKNKSPSTIHHDLKGLSLRSTIALITSLRPYAQSRGSAMKTLTTPAFASNTVTRSRPIAPWPVLLQQVPPMKERKSTKDSNKENALPRESPSKVGTWKKGHKRTMTPGPEPEPAPVFHPLRPPKARTMRVPDAFDGKATLKPSASSIFGSSTGTSKANATKGSLSSPASLGRRASAFLRKRCSLLPVPVDVSMGDLSFSSPGSGSRSGSDVATSMAAPAEKRRRMPATLGGSDVSCYAVPELDASDPDSDIPDELQFILKANYDRGEEDDTFDIKRRFIRDDVEDDDDDEVEHPRSVDPPFEDLQLPPEMMDTPIFRASLTSEGGVQGEIDDVEHGDAEFDPDVDTKKSFDFTGELQKLNESGASDRRSFVEQLEKAFRTPAKVDLRSDFGGLLRVEVPPVPPLSLDIASRVPPVPPLPLDIASRGISSRVSLDFSRLSTGEDSMDKSVNLEQSQMEWTKDEQEDDEPEAFDMYEVSRLVDVKEPTFFSLPSSKCEETGGEKDSTSRLNIETISNLVDVEEPTNMFSSSLDIDSANETGHVIVSTDPSEVADMTFSSRSSKFGGLTRPGISEQPKRSVETLTLSDIIPPPSHVRSLSSPSSPSILAKVSDIPQPRPRKFLQVRKSTYRHSQASSIASFTGLDSFEELRRGFEFNPNRPTFYPPPHDSGLSIASVSSYGHVINPGVPDPFDFGLPSLQERPSSESLSTMSFSIDDTFSFLNHASRRRRVDSDASSFYFHDPTARPGHRRNDFYNRSFGTHRRNDSSASMGSRSAWRSSHRFNTSVDSILSDFSAMRLGRPGLGDKMFGTIDQVWPPTSISASPAEIVFIQMPQQPTYDSIMDVDKRTSMDISDSIFDKTGQRTSILSEDSVFGYDSDSRIQPGQLPPHQFRPLSFISMNSVHSSAKDNDTMITMLGGGHVRRSSLGSIMEASPCARVEKRKHSVFQGVKASADEYDSPNKARIVERPSISPSFQFGSERMIHGLLERRSLEDSCLAGDGEDISISLRPVPVFTRPPPASRSRSSTCTSSSGGDTPPLSASDGSSVSGSSMSSIDLAEIDAMLSNTTHPVSTLQHARTRARARGHGHRRRYSHVRASQSNSVYETIEEELPSAVTSPAHSVMTEKTSSPTQSQPVFIVESDMASIHSTPDETVSIWDDERGIIALRRYYALQDEVQSTVTESKRVWSDTPFPVSAVQSFEPPHHAEGMKALLEHSVQTYGPLPSELRPHRIRSRRDSRPSPYPQSRPPKVTNSPEMLRPSAPFSDAGRHSLVTPVLQQALLNKKMNVPVAAPILDSIKSLPPLIPHDENTRKPELTQDNKRGITRPRVASNARRTALGWTKRSTGPKGSTEPANITGGKLSTGASTMSTDQKENVVGMGNIITPGDNLRFSRPRPKGRPTPASTTRKVQRPIRV